jgi:exodeoxyribonuclease V alpha subunit
MDDRSRLYLFRYWFYEDALIRFLEECADSDKETGFDWKREKKRSRFELEEILESLFPEERASSEPEGEGNRATFPERQKIAVLAALRKRFVVISGSPGTGKTTTAARIIALLEE